MPQLLYESIELVSPRLPPELDGTRILHLSDLHVCSRAARQLRRVARDVAESRPDLVVLTGDLVNHKRHWPCAVEWLRGLPVDPDVPRLAVSGNWDIKLSGGGEAFTQAMHDAGFRPLNNQGLSVALRSGNLQVAGLEDIRCGAFHPASALQDLRTNDFLLGLCHNPDILLYLSPWPFDCMLTGHTHGGQIRLPGPRALVTSTLIGTPFASGLFALAEHQWLYISRGVGTGLFPVRWNCPPELAVITLRFAA
jgi:hypothetical protein